MGYSKPCVPRPGNPTSPPSLPSSQIYRSGVSHGQGKVSLVWCHLPSTPPSVCTFPGLTLPSYIRVLESQVYEVPGPAVCSQPLPPHLTESPPSLGYQDSKWVFPGTGSVSPQDTVPRFAPHFTQRHLRRRLRPHFSSDPGSGLLSTLEQALGTGRVPAGPPRYSQPSRRAASSQEGRLHFLCSSQQLRTVLPGPKPQDHLRISCPSHPPASHLPNVHTSLASFLVSTPPSCVGTPDKDLLLPLWTPVYTTVLVSLLPKAFTYPPILPTWPSMLTPIHPASRHHWRHAPSTSVHLSPYSPLCFQQPQPTSTPAIPSC